MTANDDKKTMDAASALTRLQEDAQEESGGSASAAAEKKNKTETAEDDTASADGKEKKRFLPEHKKPDAAPTFPEKLMKMMRYAQDQDKDGTFCVGWVDDGKSFVIRKPDAFTKDVVPKFFKPTKFSSFTRKLYRWGFRQVNRGIGPDDPIIFGNECFQRDHEELMTEMKSVTAASTRKAEQHQHNTLLQRGSMLGGMGGHPHLPGGMAGFLFNQGMMAGAGMKHPLDTSLGSVPFDEQSHKRFMVDQIYQHKAMLAQGNNGGGSGAGTLSLTNALRPNMGFGPSGGMSNFGDNSGMMGSPSQQQHHFQQMGQFMSGGGGGQPMGNSSQRGGYNAQSTAEIVNAAIAALRYAN